MLSLNNITETFLDFPDGESLSVIVFFNGCIHNCPGCQNPELQIYNNSKEYTFEEIFNIIKERCTRNKTNKVVLSGGDPFYNQEDIIRLINLLEKNDYNVCAYTGYTIEKVEEFYKNFKNKYSVNPTMPTFIKCGVYNENKRDNAMGKYNDKFILASTNQAFYARILEDNIYKFKKISKNHILYF